MSAGVTATVRRVRDALMAAGVDVAGGPVDADEPGPLLVVDPAAWYAAQPIAPSAARLDRTVGLSLAPYGSVAMQDDAAVGRRMAVIVHPDARSARHLRRVGCRSGHVPLGCRPDRPFDVHDARPLALLSFGASCARRLRVLAGGAPWFDHLRCAHRFDEELDGGDVADPWLATAHVLLDVAPDDDAAPDPVLLLAALEAGAAVATERLGVWPGDVAEHLVRAPRQTLCARAAELAQDPDLAAALAASALAVLADAFPLGAMGSTLGALLVDASSRKASPGPREDRPALSDHAPPTDARRSVAQVLEDEQSNPDTPMRNGLAQVLSGVRRLDRRLTQIEHGDAPDATDVLHAAPPASGVRVSVLVPAFDAARTVLQALDSVHATAGEDGAPALEVVLVDDASSQDDAAAAVAWARAHPDLPVTVLRHTRNRGLASARNSALEHARGQLVLPLDADNLLRPRGLRRLLDGLEAEPRASFAYGLLQEFDTTGPAGLRGLYPWDPVRLRWGNYIDALALVRRDVLRDVGGYTVDMPEQGYEDWDLWCRLAEQGASGVWVPEIVASYRLRADSMSAALHLSHIVPLADMLERHPELLG